MELRFEDVSKKYGEVFAVDNVSYSMETGVYGLLGVNGAGKTTLMTMLCTVTRPTAGKITWNGNDIFSMGEQYRDLLGYLPQDFGFYPDLSVSDYMMYIASIKGIRSVVAKKRIKELLEMVGLSKYRERRMKALSGGMARRVGIAQAMLNDPKILVLDEPTAGLDPNERIRFRNLISGLAKDRLVLLSTHIVSDVEFIAEQIILMKDGKFFFTGTSEELIAGMEEGVWRCTVPSDKVNQYMQRYPVGNVKHVSGGVELRILSKTPPSESAVQEEPTLEDAFLLYFGEKAGDEDVEN
ncbi:MAG: ABC transporter ATP-binding protein [Clostridium sp.]|nr:ABC transporter ATP-binding protein [Clostridium sp.]